MEMMREEEGMTRDKDSAVARVANVRLVSLGSALAFRGNGFPHLEP